jgi:hypothetical protein
MAELNTVKGKEGTKLRRLFEVLPTQETCNVSDPRIRHFRSMQIRIYAFDDPKIKKTYC